MKIWLWRLIPTLFAALALGWIYLTFGPAGNEPAPRAAANRGISAFVVHPEPKPLADLAFTQGEGNPVNMVQFRGRTVLLNVWATWCAPCRKEMPDLAELQQKLGGEDFEVVAVSIDRQGKAVAEAFLKETGADGLKLYLDPSARILSDLQSVGLPTTILVDREGREIGRLMGPAEWASPEAIDLINSLKAN